MVPQCIGVAYIAGWALGVRPGGNDLRSFALVD
jgi:hypothetical protein